MPTTNSNLLILQMNLFFLAAGLFTYTSQKIAVYRIFFEIIPKILEYSRRLMAEIMPYAAVVASNGPGIYPAQLVGGYYPQAPVNPGASAPGFLIRLWYLLCPAEQGK